MEKSYDVYSLEHKVKCSLPAQASNIGYWRRKDMGKALNYQRRLREWIEIADKHDIPVADKFRELATEILTKPAPPAFTGYQMRATGIVRHIDDLGRVVIPKEIRKSMGLTNLNGEEPLEIFTTTDRYGNLMVCFKLYKPE